MFVQDNNTAMDPTSSLKVTNVSAQSNDAMTDEPRPDSSFEDGYDEDLPYPKAGNGIILPPESEDLEWLLDDDYETFSHTVNGLPVYMREVALNRNRDPVGAIANFIEGQLNGVLSVGA